MKPFDPRLLRYARAARGVLLAGAGLGLLRTAAVIAWCWALAQSITAVALPVLASESLDPGRVAEGAMPEASLPGLVALGIAAIAVRSAAAWGMDAVAAAGAVRVKAQLRAAALDALDARPPVRDDGRSDAELTTVLGRGLDALDGYFSGYVPQLILTAVATPPLLIAVLLADPLSGITVILVFPVIPVFMILIGLATQAVQDRQWAQLRRLSSSFLDAVSGLATLKIFGRAERQVDRIARETGEYRARTMQVLRVTFLSGFVLDLAGTFSIALVAVTVGTRLVAGEFPLGLGLFVLLLLPEVFIPIRQVGAAFHASTEGLAAADDVFALIEEARAGAAEGAAAAEPRPEAGSGTASGPRSGEGRDRGAGIALDAVAVSRGGRPVVGPVDLAVAPGEVVALAGPSGAGKSTLLATLLGFVPPAAGRVAAPEVLAWAGQRPGLLQGTVAENIALGDAPGETDPGAVRAALHRVGLAGIDPELALGAGGTGLSGGQAQRVALARALYRAERHPGAAVLADEPTSALDADSERVVCGALRAAADAGSPVLVVSHRDAVLAAADRVVRI